MGLREMRVHWPSSLAGALCALVSVLGVWVVVATGRTWWGAALIVGGVVLLLAAVLVALRRRGPGQPL